MFGKDKWKEKKMSEIKRDERGHVKKGRTVLE